MSAPYPKPSKKFLAMADALVDDYEKRMNPRRVQSLAEELEWEHQLSRRIRRHMDKAIEAAIELRSLHGAYDYLRGHLEHWALENVPYEPAPRGYTKANIPQWLRVQVFERDAYRCRHCGGHRDLACDHIIPESKGGDTTLENLQTLCKRCNSSKGVKVMPHE